MSALRKTRILFFIRSGAGRIDWDKAVFALLAELCRQGAEVTLLLAWPYLLRHYREYGLPYRIIMLDGAVRNGSVTEALLGLPHVIRHWRSGQAYQPPGWWAKWRYLRETAKFRALLRGEQADAVLALNYWTDFSPLVSACLAQGVPAISLQHAGYYSVLPPVSEQEPMPGKAHDWPCSHTLLFSEEAKHWFQTRFGSQSKAYVTGYFPKLRYGEIQKKAPLTVRVYESDDFAELPEFYSYLAGMVGRANIQFKEHPWKKKQGTERPLPSELDTYSDRALDDEAPGVVVSLGSTVSLEAIALGIPAVTLTYELEIFPEHGSFPKERWREAANLAARLQADENLREEFLALQRKEIAPHLLEDQGRIAQHLAATVIAIARKEH